ncbi:MAG TPA: asparagine synthase-related protein [Thermoanaerobaculia bacterium]|nr:asparagine synthase-related protein [Thermoanaerobaculia bacterium]
MGERQPLADESDRVVLVFDGRLDNREELISALGNFAVDRSASDAKIVLASYRRWGTDFVAKLLGPFALAVCDEQRARLLLARDAMGDRVLYFHVNEERVAAASEEAALLAYPGVSDEVDFASVVRLFAFDAPPSGGTYFRDISEVREGEVVVVDSGGLRRRAYWRPDPRTELRLRREEDYAERFRELLERSVAARMRATRVPAVMMSGGLDSTTIASLAARQLRAGSGVRLKTYSWVFEELPSCDERGYMDLVIGEWRLDARRVVGDRAWPLSAGFSTVQNPNVPLRGAYRELRDLLFDQAASAGERVLLTGEFADELYTGGEDWLRDLAREHRWITAFRVSARGVGERFLLHRRGVYGLRTGVRRLFQGAAPDVTHVAPDWLTPDARRLLHDSWAGSDRESDRGAVRIRQHENVFHRLSLLGALSEAFDASLRGIELRRPYRDRRLVEFMLSVPAHQLFRPGWPKWVLRRGAEGLLPDALRRRRVPTSLEALFKRGFVGAGNERIRRTLLVPDAWWRDFLPSEVVERVLASRDGRREITRETLAVWSCVGLELWRRNRARSSGASRNNEITLSKEVRA